MRKFSPQRLAAVLAAFFFGAFVGACAGAAPVASPEASRLETTPPTAAAPSITPAPAPAGWRYLPMDGVAMEIAVPEGWLPNDQHATWSPDPSSPADVIAGAEWWNAKVEAGAIAIQAVSQDDPTTTWALLVLVERGDASLDAFVDRAVHEFPLTKEAGRHEAQTVLGRAVVVDLVTVGSTFVGASRDYHFRLADGRSMLVEVSATREPGSSPMSAEAVAAVADPIVVTLRPSR